MFSFSKEIELCKIFAGSTDQIHEFLPWVQSNPRFLSSSFLLTSESSKADQCCTHSNYLYQDTWKRVGKTTLKQVTEIWTGFCTWCKICSELIIFQILLFTGYIMTLHYPLYLKYSLKEPWMQSTTYSSDMLCTLAGFESSEQCKSTILNLEKHQYQGLAGIFTHKTSILAGSNANVCLRRLP